MEKIIENIVSNLQKNGFPSKKVSFPKASLETFMKKHDFDLEDVLDEMKQDDIYSKLNGDKIIFSSEEFSNETPEFDMSAIKNMDPSKLKEHAQNMMKNLSPSDLEKYRDMYDKMSPEEKMKIMETAKQMGLYP